MRFSLILITLRFFFSGYNLSSTCFKPSFISGIFYFILECIIITTIIITIVIILVFYLWSIEYAWMGSLFVGHPYKLFYLQFFLYAEFIFTLSCSLFSILSWLSFCVFRRIYSLLLLFFIPVFFFFASFFSFIFQWFTSTCHLTIYPPSLCMLPAETCFTEAIVPLYFLNAK